jgi:4'-phosphopantetheinyl transferase
MLAAFSRGWLVRDLPLNVVDLWFATLPEMDFSLDAVLSVDEMRRASRFRFARDAANFVARRGILRLILATYTGALPSKLSFTYNQFGKPAIDGCCNIRFNMSKSGGFAVYAVARQRDLGVDLEQFGRTPLEMSSVAGSFFGERQNVALNEAPVNQKEEMFLRLWTQLEAQGKMRGVGIGGPNPASSELNAFPAKCFSFARLVPTPGYSVAVAVQGRCQCSLRTMLWSRAWSG